MSSPLVYSQRTARLPTERLPSGDAGLAGYFAKRVCAVNSVNIKQQTTGEQAFKEDPKQNSQVLRSVLEIYADISINKTILTLRRTFPTST